MNKFIMQPKPIVIFRLLFSRVHSPFIHFRKENEIRSLHFIHFYAQSMEVIALTMMTEGTMTSFDHEVSLRWTYVSMEYSFSVAWKSSTMTQLIQNILKERGNGSWRVPSPPTCILNMRAAILTARGQQTSDRFRYSWTFFLCIKKVTHIKARRNVSLNDTSLAEKQIGKPTLIIFIYLFVSKHTFDIIDGMKLKPFGDFPCISYCHTFWTEVYECISSSWSLTTWTAEIYNRCRYAVSAFLWS